MNLVQDSEFVDWLESWSGEFDWNKGNLRKNEKQRRRCFMKSLKEKTKTGRSRYAEKEFDSMDLGDTLKTFRAEGRWVKPKTRPTSIALSQETIEALRQKASRKGIGYQTLLKMIVQEHLHEY